MVLQKHLLYTAHVFLKRTECALIRACALNRMNMVRMVSACKFGPLLFQQLLDWIFIHIHNYKMDDLLAAYVRKIKVQMQKQSEFQTH